MRKNQNERREIINCNKLKINHCKDLQKVVEQKNKSPLVNYQKNIVWFFIKTAYEIVTSLNTDASSHRIMWLPHVVCFKVTQQGHTQPNIGNWSENRPWMCCMLEIVMLTKPSLPMATIHTSGLSCGQTEGSIWRFWWFVLPTCSLVQL